VRMLRVSSLVVLLLCVAAFFAVPSHQHGTIFTDFITPAFSNVTYFTGIETFESFSTEARIGVIRGTSLRGFGINTPGPISSTTDNINIIANQNIQFGNENSLGTIAAFNDLAISGQGGDILARGNLGFNGEGGVRLGGLESRIRSAALSLSTSGNTSIRSSGSQLNIAAPVAVAAQTTGPINLSANNNIEVLSSSGRVNIEARREDLRVHGNYLSFDALD